jgi:hypothetical protein
MDFAKHPAQCREDKSNLLAHCLLLVVMAEGEPAGTVRAGAEPR